MLLDLFQTNAGLEDLFGSAGKKQQEWDLQSNIFSAKIPKIVVQNSLVQKYQRINPNNSNTVSHM